MKDSRLSPSSRLGGAVISDRIVAALLDELRTGRYAEADRLPAEVDLAAQLGVSRTVIRDALSEMERAGYIERVRGIGTVVNRSVLGLRSRLDQKLEYYPLINQEMVIITPIGHELSELEDISLEELCRYPIIGYDKNSWMGIHLSGLYKKYEAEPNIVVECPDEYSIVALVRENFGVALMPRTDILDNHPGVSIHGIRDLAIYHQIFMFWSKDAYHLPAVERFISYMKKQADVINDSVNVSKVYLKDIINY